jgi:hypothetical protein
MDVKKSLLHAHGVSGYTVNASRQEHTVANETAKKAEGEKSHQN